MSASSQTNDLKNRIIFTIFILAVYRFGTFVPIPGIDPEQLQTMMSGNQKGLLGMFNVFSGGAVSRMAIFALGIMPYISSSIIVQLLTGVSDYFKNLKAQGETGRAKITQITRYGTVILATVQGYGLSIGLQSSPDLVINPGSFFTITAVSTIVAGTMFLMWLGEQITQRGIGNGISLIIFAGIVAEIPRALVTTFELGRTGAVSTIMIIGIFVLLIATIMFIVFMERALRKILINYPKRQMGNKMYGGESSHLPLKINQAGVIPAIFAALIISSSTDLKPARKIAIINPDDCHTPAITIVYIDISGVTNQSNLKVSKPISWANFSIPSVGFRTHFQAVPVTINDKAIGYK